jgi:CheY-like chemotaxis protein
MPSPEKTAVRPLAHVALRDEGKRIAISDALRAEGWAVVDSKSGYHLLQTLSEPLLSDRLWWHPTLVVVDAFSPGCSGLSIARGLRDLGWPVASVVIDDRARNLAHRERDLRGIYITDHDMALRTVLEVARRRRDNRDNEPRVTGSAGTDRESGTAAGPLPRLTTNHTRAMA